MLITSRHPFSSSIVHSKPRPSMALSNDDIRVAAERLDQPAKVTRSRPTMDHTAPWAATSLKTTRKPEGIMPHFTLEYSANLDARLDIGKAVEVVRKAAVETGVFPLGGIRVRAVRCGHFAIADGNPDLGFIAMVLR